MDIGSEAESGRRGTRHEIETSQRKERGETHRRLKSISHSKSVSFETHQPENSARRTCQPSNTMVIISDSALLTSMRHLSIKISHDRRSNQRMFHKLSRLGCSTKTGSSSDHLVGVHHTEADRDIPLAAGGGFAEEAAHHTGLSHKQYVSRCNMVRMGTEQTFSKREGTPTQLSHFGMSISLTLRRIASLTLTVALGGLAVWLTLWGVLLSMRLLTIVLSWRRLTVRGTARGTTVSGTTSWSVAFLILCVVARVNCAKE